MSNTKTCYLDANILVFFKESSSDRHHQTVGIVEKLVAENFTLFISSLGLDEFLHAALRYLRMKNSKDIGNELKELLSSILQIPNLKIVNPSTHKKSQLKIVDFMTSFSLRPRDAYHLLMIKENKLGYFATLDSDFDRVFDVKIVKRI